LSEVILAWLDAVGGPIASSIWFGLVSIAIYTLVWSIAGLDRPLRMADRVVLTWIVCALTLPVWLPRAQLYDILFALVVVRVLFGYTDTGARRWLITLPITGVVWANLHGGGAIFAFLLVAAVVAGVWWNRRGGRRHPPIWPILVATVAMAAAICVNPYGIEMLVYPFATVFSSAQAETIQEWLSPDFHDLGFRPLQLYLALGLGLFYVRRITDGRRLAIVVGLTIMTLQAGRYVGFFGTIVPALIFPTATEAWALVARRLPFHRRRTATMRWPQIIPIINTIVIGLVLWASVTNLVRLTNEMTPTRFPVAATEWLTGTEGRIWNTYGWGGYLAYHLGIDPKRIGPYGAADALGDTRLIIAKEVDTLVRDPRPTFTTFGVDLVVTTANGPLRRWLDEAPEWTIVYEDELAVIACRTTPTSPPSDRHPWDPLAPACLDGSVSRHLGSPTTIKTDTEP
jgi:hypothetical protein